MLVVTRGMAQPEKAFTPDSALFLTELNQYLEATPGPYQRDMKRLTDKLAFEWQFGQFKEPYRSRMYVTANRMLQEKLKPYPDFYKFLKVILYFYDTRQSLADYDSLHASFIPLLDLTSKKPFSEYLQSLDQFLEDRILYDYRGVQWKCSQADFIFIYDTVPRFSLKDVTLVCFASRDSIRIENTQGLFYPAQNLWRGSGGIVTWERAGYSADSVFAELEDYTVGLKNSGYSADNVTFHHRTYFKQPLKGKLEDKVTSFTSRDQANYPVFESYIKRIQIVNLFRDITFDGAFRMEGADVLGYGSEDRDASVTVHYKGKEFIVLKSPRFIIHRDRINAQRAAVSVYFESDSIYHPGLQFKYIDSSRELALYRGNEGLSQSPFYDSYHEVDMFFETFSWKVGEPYVQLEKMKGLNPKSEAHFESNQFYTEDRFDHLMGIDQRHPLIMIRNFVRNNPDRTFYIPDLAAYLQKPTDQVRALIIQLTNQGFLNYDVITDRATAKEKLYDYIDANNGKTDYDAISFLSEVESQSNATLNVKSFDLLIKGVPMVSLSDSQQVYLYPNNSEILLQQNRNFVFSGRVHAGLLDFYPKESTFNYDSFKLSMPVIDSLSFMVPSHRKDKENNPTLERIRSVIRNLNGTLWIDHPTNKSGLKDFPYYPYFTSEDDSYVYYNDPDIQNGRYSDSLFYYQVYPFTFDSLNQFTTEGIQFQGKLVSGGILPDIEHPISVQEDYSLGFVNKSPDEGYSIYQGKGQFMNEIKLSNKGLKGSGTIKYLTSTAVSDNFTYLPDLVTGPVNSFLIKETATGVEYPDVVADSGYFRWFTGKDSLLVTSVKDKPFNIYNAQATMKGILKLTPDHLYGDGVVAVKDGEIEAKDIVFNHHVFSSDTTNFRLLTMDKAQLALSTYVYRANVDMKERVGEFSSTGGTSLVELPSNQYICFMDKFEWLMDEEKISLYNTLSVDTLKIGKLSYKELMDADLKGSEFISTHPKQDSLEFFSLKALYDLKENILYAGDVKYIKVADAAVFPVDGKVTIGRNAQMAPLQGATIIADTARKSHVIYDATVSIQSRKKYQASGKYDYTDELGNVNQILFNNISTDSSNRTFAVAQIPDTVNFSLSPYFDFKGKALLVTSREFLTFDGGYRIRQDCDPFPPSWVKFTAEVDPKNLALPVEDTLVDVTSRRISDALVLSAGYEIYPVFFGRKDRMDETEILSASGFITYDKPSEEYRISSGDSIARTEGLDSYLSLSNKNCVLYGEGEIRTGLNYDEVKMSTYGSGTYYIVPDSATFNMFMSLDFYFAQEILGMMTDKFMGSNMPGIDITSGSYRKALTFMAGKKAADELLTELSLYGSLRKLPPALQHTLVLSDVNMVWNKRTKSYISRGQIGISSILDRSVNKYAGGVIELAKRRNGDELTIYLETAEKEWFFFNYSNHIMQSISSDDLYNTTLSELKETRRVLNLENSKNIYQYIISTRQKMIEFISRIQAAERR
jgi:hypothetical protein